jgi:hypothetical protein
MKCSFKMSVNGEYFPGRFLSADRQASDLIKKIKING